MFNSKNRQKIKIAFRLGGYDGNCTGTAWFSDFKLERGTSSENTTWKFACFIFDNTNVNFNGKDIKLQISDEDKERVRENLERFKKSCRELSGYNMSVSYDVIEIEEPITRITFDEKNGYYVNPKDVDNLISKYIKGKEYDHIFAIIRMGDTKKSVEIPVYDWIGLRRHGLLWNWFFKHKASKWQ